MIPSVARKRGGVMDGLTTLSIIVHISLKRPSSFRRGLNYVRVILS